MDEWDLAASGAARSREPSLMADLLAGAEKYPEQKGRIAQLCFRHGDASVDLSTSHWWQAIFIGRYTFSDLISLSARIEYFDDSDGVMQQSIIPFNRFQVFSSGACLNIKANHNALIRFDVRNFSSVDAIYKDKVSNPTRQSWWSAMSLTAWF